MAVFFAILDANNLCPFLNLTVVSHSVKHRPLTIVIYCEKQSPLTVVIHTVKHRPLAVVIPA